MTGTYNINVPTLTFAREENYDFLDRLSRDLETLFGRGLFVLDHPVFEASITLLRHQFAAIYVQFSQRWYSYTKSAHTIRNAKKTTAHIGIG